MLPGEAHATQHLDGVLGRPHAPVDGQGPGGGGGEPRLVGIVGILGQRGVPGGRRHLLDQGQQVGQLVLDPLELSDGPAELDPGAGVLGRRLQAPSGAARQLGRPQDQRQVAHLAGGHTLEDASGHHRHLVQPDLGGPPGEVEAGAGHHRHPRSGTPVGRHQIDRGPGRRALLAGSDGHRDQQHRRQAGAEDGRERAGHQQGSVGRTTAAHRLCARWAEGHAGRRRTVQQAGEQRLGLDTVGTPGHQGRRQDSRQKRSRGRGPSQLLTDHGQFEDAEPLPAETLGHVDAQPALLGQVRPDRRQDVVGAIEQGPGHLARAVPLDPAPYGPAQFLVLLAHPDGHRDTSVVRTTLTRTCSSSKCRGTVSRRHRRLGGRVARGASRRQGLPAEPGAAAVPTIGAAR